MLLSPTSSVFDNGASQRSSKLAIDEDEADLTVLSENLENMNEYCNEISDKLRQISIKNSDAIRGMKPLMLKINTLKLQQKNINATEAVIHKVKEYASSIKKLDVSLGSVADLRNLDQIGKYCNILSGYERIRGELIKRGLNGFQGLMKGLNHSINDCEGTLKYEMKAELKRLSELESGLTFNKDEERVLIKQVEFIYEYMKNERSKSTLDIIVSNRSSHILKLLKERTGITLPNLVKDQNYLYGGCGKDLRISFVNYTGQAMQLLVSEFGIVSKLITSTRESQAAFNKIIAPLLQHISDTGNSFLTFASKNKYAYATLLYEIVDGLSVVFSTVQKFPLETPEDLMTTFEDCKSRARLIFQQLFEFIHQRYVEMVVTEHPNETLNNTFMMLVTRLNKFSLFKEQQLQVISQTRIGSWLPQYRPKGFQEIRTMSNDPLFLLSTFYSDAIEYSFYMLAEKLEPHMLEEDLGVMLLFNLDGFQNLLDSKSNMKNILGQQGISRVERLKKKAIDKATSGWSDMTTKLMEASTKQGDSFNMSNKEMGKFVDSFTRSFNENYRKLQNKNLPPFFKKELAQNIRKMLGPAYRVFYMSVAQDSSAKSVLKHFKYSIGDFEHQLVTLA